MNKLAVITLDVNICKLKIAKFTDDGFMTILEEKERSLTIGRDVNSDFLLKAQHVYECENAIKRFKEIIYFYNVSDVYCYYTPALSKARNIKNVVDQFFTTTGYLFEEITNEQYCSYIHSTAFNTMDASRNIIINIDSDRINFIKYVRKHISDTFTFDFGANTLSNMFMVNDVAPEERMQNMIDYCIKQFENCEFFKDCDEDNKIIGIGASFVNTAKICRLGTKYSYNSDHNYVITKQNLNNAYNVIKPLDIDKTKKIKNISEERADIIASGCAIIKAIMERFNLEKINTCSKDVTTGIVYSLIYSTVGDKMSADILTNSLRSSNYFYDLPENNTIEVANIASEIFDQLHVIHKFGKQESKILKIASYFCLSGKRISNDNFEKNSFDVILNSNIYGVSHKEIILAAFVSSSQNLIDFNFANYVRYKDILQDDECLDIIKKLAIFVRLARITVMSRTMERVVCDALGDNCIVSVVSKSGEPVDVEELRTVTGDFKKAFGKNLQVL